MMRIATKQGLTNNMASMSGVLDQCQAHLGDPFETVFYEPFKNITGKIHKLQQTRELLRLISWFC